MANKKIGVELELINGKYMARIRQSDAATRRFAKRTQSGLKMMSASYLGTAVSVGALLYGGKKVLDITDQQARSVAQLEAALASTNHAAGLTSQELQDMAAGLQEVTTYGDEVTMKAQAMLLTFTKIGKDVFPQATETVLNMAEAMGTDLKTQAIQVGKALNDPILGVTALRRVGVQLSDQQTKQIKQFVKMGDVASAQKIILGELETQFGGVARAMANTPLGPWKQLANSLGDMVEDIGEGLVPSTTNLAQVTLYAADAEGIFSAVLGSTTKVVALAVNSVSQLVLWMERLHTQSKQQDAHKENVKLLNKQIAIYKELGIHQGYSDDKIRDSYRLYRQMVKDGKVDLETRKQMSDIINKRLAATSREADMASRDAEMSQKMKEIDDAILDGQKNLNKEHEKALKLKQQLANVGADATSKAEKEASSIDKLRQEYEKLYEYTISAEQRWQVARDVDVKQGGYEARMSLMKEYGSALVEQTSSTLSQLSDLYSMYHQNRVTEIDNAYYRRKEIIQRNVSDEAAREAALARLEADYTMRKRKEERRAAKQQKSIAIVQTVISTAQGAVDAYKSMVGIPYVGPALGAIAAAAFAAFGAYRISLIKNQQIPSYDVGAWRINRDHQATVHRGEMYLPPSFAESVRRGDAVVSAPGATGAVTHNHYNIDGILDTGGLEKIMVGIEKERRYRRTG